MFYGAQSYTSSDEVCGAGDEYKRGAPMDLQRDVINVPHTLQSGLPFYGITYWRLPQPCKFGFSFLLGMTRKLLVANCSFAFRIKWGGTRPLSARAGTGRARGNRGTVVRPP